MSALRLLLACSICFCLGVLIRPALSQSLSQELATLLQVRQLIATKALQTPEPEHLMQAATEGLLQALADPYSIYLSPPHYSALQAEKSGQIVGLGLEIAYRNQQVLVMSVLDDTPAAASRLRAGDQILKIDHQALSALSWAEINARLSGEIGQAVTLDYLQQGQLRQERLIRQVLKLEPLRAQRLAADLCYLKITTFLSEDLHQKVKQTLETLAPCTQGLILDLQNNPGGLLQEAIEVAGLLGVQGTVV